MYTDVDTGLIYLRARDYDPTARNCAEVHPMTKRGERRGGVTAEEFLAQLANDPDYQERRAKNKRELERRAAVWAQEQAPVVDALRRAGVRVDSVWDLVNTSVPYPDALPVLVEEMERGYPDRAMEGIGRALAVKPAVVYWDRLKALYLHPRSPGEEDGAAVALAGSAGPAQVDDLMALLSNEGLGDSRIYFVRPLMKLGGTRGRKFVEERKDHPVLGKEATALLRQRRVK